MRDKTYLGDEIPGKQNFPQIHDIFTNNSFSVFHNKMSELSENVLTRFFLQDTEPRRFLSHVNATHPSFPLTRGCFAPSIFPHTWAHRASKTPTFCASRKTPTGENSPENDLNLTSECTQKILE